MNYTTNFQDGTVQCQVCSRDVHVMQAWCTIPESCYRQGLKGPVITTCDDRACRDAAAKREVTPS